MPVTVLDPTSALLVIDLQEGIVSLPTVHPSDEIVARASTLAAAFRAAGKPVVLVNVAGGAPGRNELPKSTRTPAANWTELVADLDAQPDDHRVTKLRWGAFTDTDLHAHLQANNVTQVVIAGIATSIGVESTARSAYEHGYHVTLVTDAMTDLDPATHANSVERVFPKLGESGTTADVLALLATE
jgi:nicotinamidase-related amidase